MCPVTTAPPAATPFACHSIREIPAEEAATSRSTWSSASGSTARRRARAMKAPPTAATRGTPGTASIDSRRPRAACCGPAPAAATSTPCCRFTPGVRRRAITRSSATMMLVGCSRSSARRWKRDRCTGFASRATATRPVATRLPSSAAIFRSRATERTRRSPARTASSRWAVRGPSSRSPCRRRSAMSAMSR